MMRFGSIDMFMEFGDWDFRIGRPVANEGFLKALLSYGSYDKYEFFCPDVYHMNTFSEKTKTLIKDPDLHSRIKYSLQIALLESLEQNAYDIFHLGDFTYFMPYLVDIRNRYSKNPFPITGVTHSLDANYMNIRYIQLAIAGLQPYDGIICTSKCAEKAVRNGLDRSLELLNKVPVTDPDIDAKLIHIPLGIEDDFFNDMNQAEVRRHFSIPENMTVILSIGRLSLRKKNDWSPILELIARMYAKGDLENTIFLLAGGAEDSDITLMESLISRLSLDQKVLLFPNFPADTKTRLYKAADIYISIVDNFQETFGINIIEAMASGLPVIASDFSGYRELVTNGENGFLIPTTWIDMLPEFLKNNTGILDPSLNKFLLSQTVAVDLENLRNSITTLVSNIELRKRFGIIAKKDAEQYRWKSIIQAYETFWAELSKEAKDAGPVEPDNISNLLIGDFQDTFRHYPTMIISDTEKIALTELGNEVLNKKYNIIRYEDIAACLFPELENLILSIVSEAVQSVKTIKQKASEALNASGGEISFHIQWLLKHGAIKIQST